jgi:hypothetical protein
MTQQRELVARHVDALMAEAAAARVPADLIGRELLTHVVRLYRTTRGWDDIAGELRFVADNVDPETEFTFMRP